ncbi:hypothetical protein Hanom_Chr07g00676281 [Helianthus anomalus]
MQLISVIYRSPSKISVSNISTDIIDDIDLYNRYITQLLVLNCYIYKLYMILKVLISHRDNLYLKYRSLTDIQYFTALTA